MADKKTVKKAVKTAKTAKPKKADKAGAADGAEKRTPPRLKIAYYQTIRPDLAKRFGGGNPLAAPKLEKVVVNIGVGQGTQDRKKVEAAQNDLTLIAGQRAVITRARRSEAGFKLRAGQPIGAKVTMRRDRMYEFIDRLITIALPRARDFRGLSPKSFDGHGNYSFGIGEHIVFPEIDYDKADQIWGMDISVCTSAKKDEEAQALLEAFRFPFAAH